MLFPSLASLPLHSQKIMSRVKLLPLCSRARPLRRTAWPCRKSACSLRQPLHRLFLKSSDRQILQNILPVQLNQYLIGLIPFSSVCPPVLHTPKTDRTAGWPPGYKDCNLQITWSAPTGFILLINLISQSWTTIPSAVISCDVKLFFFSWGNLHITQLCPHAVSSCLPVHLSVDIRWGDGDGRGLQEPAQAKGGHFQKGERWRLSRQPRRPVEPGHRHGAYS